MDWNDSPRPRRDAGLDGRRIHSALLVAIAQDGSRPHRKDRRDGGDEGVYLGDYLVPRSDLGRAQGELERREAVVDANVVAGTAEGRKLGLEALQVIAQNEVTATQHRLDRSDQCRLQRPRLCTKIDERHMPVRG